MGKRKKSDPLISVLEHALDLGEFIPYNRSWDFVQSLEDVKHKVDALVKEGQAERTVSLYEIFLSGCYEKVGRDQLWMDLVERVRRDHFRKYSFIPHFEKIVAGRPLKKPESFKKRALKRWKKQIA